MKRPQTQSPIDNGLNNLRKTLASTAKKTAGNELAGIYDVKTEKKAHPKFNVY
jgi:hypothetical protein